MCEEGQEEKWRLSIEDKMEIKYWSEVDLKREEQEGDEKGRRGNRAWQ